MDLDIQVSKLQLLKQSFLSQKYEMEDRAVKTYPVQIKSLEEKIALYREEIALVKEHTPPSREAFPPMEIKGKVFHDKKEAGQAIIEACKEMASPDAVPVGSYRGLKTELHYSTFQKEFIMTLKGKLEHKVVLGTDIYGNITRLDHKIAQFEDDLAQCGRELENMKRQLETAKVEAAKEFLMEKELAEKTARLGELNALLNLDKKETVVLECGQEEAGKEKTDKGRER